MARNVPLSVTASLIAGAALLLAPIVPTQDPGGIPGVEPSMTMYRVGDELHLSGDTPGAPLWMIVGADRTRLPIAGVVLEIEPDLVVPVGRLDANGEAVIPLRGELPRYAEFEFWFQALALSPDARLVVSNAQRVALPVDAPTLVVHDQIEAFAPTVELFRVDCAPLMWTAAISLTVPTTGYRFELLETETDGTLFQATVDLVQPAPDALVAPAFTDLALGIDCIGPNTIERVEITLVTSFDNL